MEIEMSKRNFPDENFRNYLTVKCGIKRNACLTEHEIALVEEIEIKHLDIYDLTGIEFFLNLKKLDCSYNPLKTLNVTANLKLKQLHCAVNCLSELNLKDNKALEILDCRNNHFTHLDVSQNIH